MTVGAGLPFTIQNGISDSNATITEAHLPPIGGYSIFDGEQDTRHGGELQWPGIFGYPVRGNNVLNLKNGEESRATFVQEFHFHTFDLGKSEDREYYQWVMNRIVNGWFTKIHIHRTWDDERQCPVVYLEWTQNYYQW